MHSRLSYALQCHYRVIWSRFHGTGSSRPVVSHLGWCSGVVLVTVWTVPCGADSWESFLVCFSFIYLFVYVFFLHWLCWCDGWSGDAWYKGVYGWVAVSANLVFSLFGLGSHLNLVGLPQSHNLQFTGNKMSRGVGPKCTHKAIAKHARIIWLDKKQWRWLRHGDLTLKMAVLSSQTIHSCFAVAFRTQAFTCFVTAELRARHLVNI